MFFDLLQSVLDYCGIEGLVLAPLIVLFFVVEMCYFGGYYWKISTFRLQRRQPVRLDEPPVSVIVPLYGENMNYVDEGLQQLLAQKYDQYEIVVVYVGGDDGFYADLLRMKQVYQNLRTTQIDYSPKYPLSTKMVINVGIKAASHEHIIITTPDIVPASKEWISLMARGFKYGDIVLGYSRLERTKGVINRLIRQYDMTESLGWISAAIRGKLFAASRHNYGFTKSLYFGVRGFNHLNMNVGENDLFLASIATSENVAPVLSPKASTIEKAWGGWSWWLSAVRFRGTTRRFYPLGARVFTSAELALRPLFLAASVVALIFMPLEYKIAVAILLAVRYIVTLLVMLRLSVRLGERGIMATYLLYDLIEPFLKWGIRASFTDKKDNSWR